MASAWLNYRKSGFVCQGNLGHKMWGVTPITAPGVYYDISLYEKSVHLLVCSPSKKVFFTEFRHTTCLNSNDGAWDGISFRHWMLEKNLQGCPRCSGWDRQGAFDHRENIGGKSLEYWKRALILKQKGLTEEANRHYQDAIRIDPVFKDRKWFYMPKLIIVCIRD